MTTRLWDISTSHEGRRRALALLRDASGLSVSEAGQQKEIVMVDMGEKGDVRISAIPLRPLRQVRVIRGTLEEVLREACTLR